MCCSRTPSRRSLYNALKTIDPTLPSEDQFWHGAGRRGRSADTTTTDAATAIDAAWLAITDTDRWDALTPEERLAATTTWIQARTDLLDEGLGESGIAALNRYTDRIVKRAHSRDQRRTWTRRGLMTAAATALITIGLMAGSTQPHTDANAESLFTHPTVTQSQTLDGVSVRALDGAVKTRGGKTVVYTAKGRCDTGKVIKAKKTQTVKWQWKNGNIGKKKVAKGKKVCRVVTTAQPGKTAATYVAPTNAQGVVTALPKTFPANPTTADIAALGWDYSTPVEPTVKVPRPSTPSAPARTADSLSVGKVLSATPRPNGGYDLEVEYTITGGSGVITFADSAPVKLNPSGAVTFVAKTPMPAVGSPYTMTFRGTLEPDYGQADLPATATAGWVVQSNPAVAANAHSNYSTSQAGSFAQAYDPATNTVIVYN